jgi:aminopeptidase
MVKYGHILKEITMDEIKNGARSAILQCLQIKNKDKTVIIYDNSTKAFINSFKQILKENNLEFLVLKIEDFTSRPAKAFPKKLEKSITDFKPTVSIYLASAQEGELPEFRRPLTTLLTETLKCRHAHMVGINETLMKDGMNKNYEDVYKLTHYLYSLLQNVVSINVTDKHGTNIIFTIDPDKYKWVPSDARPTIENWTNLPGGECFTYPVLTNGDFYAWVLGDNLSEKYGVLNNPVKVKVQNSKAIKVEPSDLTDEICVKASLDLEDYFKQYKDSDRVGELGIGTLLGLEGFVGNLLQDEKFPGVHMAFGYPYPNKTGAEWTCPSHMDIIARNVNINLKFKDGSDLTIMVDGHYTVEFLEKALKNN